jgi:hypothetical protein
MKTRKMLFRSIRGACLLAATVCAVSSVSASVLMFDFGTAIAAGADLSNSPLHAADSSFTGTSWNSVNTTTTGAKSGFLYADGTPASGVTLSLGRSSNTPWSTVTFAGGPTNVTSTSNPASLSGVFSSATSIGRDGHYAANASGSGDPSPTRLMATAIGGLGAGTYDVYLVGMNPNLALGASMGFWAVELPGTGNYDATALVGGGAQATSGNSVSASWIEGGNYAKTTITLSSPDSYLTLFSLGMSDAEQRGFINAIQIVAIPEPANAAGLAGLAACLGLGMLRRRRRRVS